MLRSIRKTKATCTLKPADSGFYRSYKRKAYKRARWKKAENRQNNRICREAWIAAYGEDDNSK